MEQNVNENLCHTVVMHTQEKIGSNSPMILAEPATEVAGFFMSFSGDSGVGRLFRFPGFGEVREARGGPRRFVIYLKC